jgi:predicted nuclease of restriction endonuclease-like (RecB) superfamily
MNDMIKLSEYRDWLRDLKQQIKIMKQLVSLLPIENSEKSEQLVRKIQQSDNEQNTIWQQLVAKLISIPWGHHILITQKVKDINQALFYINKTIENNWSRAVLEYQIETNLYGRQGKAITNFNLTLPKPQSDLANELMKDPYNFDFLHLSEKVK